MAPNFDLNFLMFINYKLLFAIYNIITDIRKMYIYVGRHLQKKKQKYIIWYMFIYYLE